MLGRKKTVCCIQPMFTSSPTACSRVSEINRPHILLTFLYLIHIHQTLFLSSLYCQPEGFNFQQTFIDVTSLSILLRQERCYNWKWVLRYSRNKERCARLLTASSVAAAKRLSLLKVITWVSVSTFVWTEWLQYKRGTWGGAMEGKHSSRRDICMRRSIEFLSVTSV